MDSYTQAVTLAFLQMFTVEAVRYLIAVILVLLFLALVIRKNPSKNLHKKTATSRQKWREFSYSILTCVVFAANGLYIYFGMEGGWIILYEDLDLYDVPYLIATIVGILLFHDAFFYWTHRMIHHRSMFSWVHSLHHKSVEPTVWAGYAFTPTEAFINGMVVPIWLTFVPSHSGMIFGFLAHMIMRNAMGHCGYELFPRNMPGHRFFGVLTNVFHHDLHHRDIERGNFGLYFTFWDRWMGTEHPDYTALVESQRQDRQMQA